jgi:hypothetical protein
MKAETGLVGCCRFFALFLVCFQVLCNWHVEVDPQEKKFELNSMEKIFSYTSGHRLRVCLWALERARLGGRIWIEA